MRRQVKIIEKSTYFDLERVVNEFLAIASIEFVDIKYRTWVDRSPRYSAMIIYEMQEMQP